MSKEIKILLGIGAAAIILGTLLFKFASQPNEPGGTVAERSDARFKGNAEALVTVTEFADFQCPACRAAAGLADQLVADYPDQVKVVFRHFPLAGHTHAQLAAQAAEAAGAQGKFWEMHDVLFERQDEWGRVSPARSRGDVLNLFESYAETLALETEEFMDFVRSNEASGVINRDLSDGRAAGVTGTPQFYVNGRKISTPSYQELVAEIERALNP